MAFNYKCISYKYSPETNIASVIRTYNIPRMDRTLVDKLTQVFEEINAKWWPAKPGDQILIPVIEAFAGKHPQHLHRPNPLEHPEAYDSTQHTVKDFEPDPKAHKEPVPKKLDLNYRLYPYSFARPGETIEAVIRLYNDMQLTPKMLKQMVEEFTKNNPDASPPKFGQTVQIPVLLPFCFRHENDHKIFTDE